MQQFKYANYTSTFETIHDVIKHMQYLNEELDNTDLHNLTNFNTTYLIITQNVAQKFGQKYFDEDDTMQTFDICFAKYYFDALYSYVQHKQVDASWQLLFNLCKKDNLLKTQYMALGVNAHVNNDLAFALQDTFKNRTEYKDYNKINIIISQSIQEVFDSFHEQKEAIEFLKNNLLPTYTPLLNIIIRNWRANAWKNYLALANESKARDDIKQRALIIAKRLSLYG